MYKKRVLKWSNLFFLIPLIIAINYNIYWYAIIVFTVMIISFDYHLFNETRDVYYLDRFFSLILMIANFILLFKGHWVLPYSFFAITFAISAIYFYVQKSLYTYYFNHSFWHIFAAGTCVFCLITLLSF